jgi:transposase
VSNPAEPLTNDPIALQAMLAAERAENERLRQIIKELQRHRFGRRAESLPVDQLLLGLEEVEQVEAEGLAAEEAADPAKLEARVRKRRANRGSLPAHLPRIEQVIDIPDKTCPCCKGMLHVMGEDRSERLDIVPAQFRVIVTRRPKYACRSCEEVVVQAPAPSRLIEGGIPTEATVAHVLVSKYADHLPLYRQSQIYARQGVNLDRSTLADWVGKAAFLLRPIHERLFERLKASSKLFADETTAPVLDPGRGRTKTGQLFAYARDDRPWGGIDPPGVAYIYAPDRKAEQPLRARIIKIAWILWPCEPPHEHADAGDEDPCFGGGDRFLEVPGQSAASSEPREGPFHNPSARQHLEALGAIGPLDDFQREAADPFKRAFQLRTRIAAIGEDMAQPRPAFHDGLQHLRGAVAILDSGTVDDETDQQPTGVGHDVALAAVDLLASVEAPNAAAFSGLDGLAVDDTGRWACLPSLLLPCRHDERVVDGAKHAHVAPGVEIVLHRGEGRKVLRQHAPLAAGRGHVEDRVHHLAQVRHSRSADRLRAR